MRSSSSRLLLLLRAGAGPSCRRLKPFAAPTFVRPRCPFSSSSASFSPFPSAAAFCGRPSFSSSSLLPSSSSSSSSSRSRHWFLGATAIAAAALVWSQSRRDREAKSEAKDPAALAEMIGEFTARASGGGARDQFALGVICLQAGIFDQALLWLNRAAEQGEPDALAVVGGLYEHGMAGSEELIKIDKKRAFEFYQRSAALNSSLGQWCLAESLLFGVGTEPDPAAAITLLRTAAERDNHEAAFILSRLYHTGVPSSESEGMLPSSSSSRKQPGGSASSDDLTPLARAPTVALASALPAVPIPRVGALASAANGAVLPRSPTESKKWLIAAAEHGSVEAAFICAVRCLQAASKLAPSPSLTASSIIHRTAAGGPPSSSGSSEFDSAASALLSGGGGDGGPPTGPSNAGGFEQSASKHQQLVEQAGHFLDLACTYPESDKITGDERPFAIHSAYLLCELMDRGWASEGEQGRGEEIRKGLGDQGHKPPAGLIAELFPPRTASS